MHYFYYFSVSLLDFLRIIRSQIVFHIFNTRNIRVREREREKEEERKRAGENERERATKSRTSLIHFTSICHSQNSFVFLSRSRDSLKFSTLNTSRSMHESCSRHSTIIMSFGSHACVIEGWESRSFLAFMTISIPSNSQKSTTFDYSELLMRLNWFWACAFLSSSSRYKT